MAADRPDAASRPDPEAGLSAAHSAALAAALAAHAGTEGALLPVLHAVQDSLGHVPDALLPEIGAALDRSRAEVHGVVSYYPHFRRRPLAGPLLQVCAAEACLARGAAALLRHVEVEAPPAGVHVERVYCLGLCANGPAALLDEQPLAALSAARLDRLLPGAEGST